MSGTNTPLIPANTTLLQPGSQWYRMVDAWMLLNALNNQQSSALAAQGQNQATINQSQATTNSDTQTTLTNLQNQINQINARLSAAGIP